MKTFLFGCLFIFSILASGCSTRESVRAKPLASSLPPIDLSQYQVATVVPFDINARREMAPSDRQAFAENIARRLRLDFGPLFEEVRVGEPLGDEDELIISGTIHTYRPGSRALRVLPGIASSSFEGELVVLDAQRQDPLLRASFDKLWAWAGLLGATKDMDDLVDETAAAIASTVANARGWRGTGQGNR